MGTYDKEIPKISINHKSHLWDIYYDLRDLYMSCFTWEGLPDSVNQRYLEMILFTGGKLCFFKDAVIGHLALKFADGGTLDVYGEPTVLEIYGEGKYQASRKNHVDAVVIYDNYSRITRHHRLLAYATMLDYCEVAIKQNIKHQKTPYIITGEENVINSIKAIIKDIDEGKDLIIPDKFLKESGSLEVHELRVEFIADGLQDLKQKIMNEALSFIGIENNSAQKSERVNIGEVMVSSGVAIAHRNSRYKARQIAVDEIEKIFGLELTVEYTNPSVEDLNEVSIPRMNGEVGGELDEYDDDSFT